MQFKKKFLYAAGLIVLCLLICLPMLREDFINTIDGGTALMHLYCMDQFIGHGQWYTRWIPHLYGYGYPLFNFYPPLVSLMGTAFMKMGLSIIWAMNLGCVLLMIISALSMYLLAREFFGVEGGFIAAAAYVLAPYQMIDLYLRGAYAESASFAFLPLIVWAFFKIKTHKIFYASLAALSMAGLLLTHNCISLIFSPIVLLYILLFNRRHSLFFSLSALLLGVGLSAFFWLPAMMENKFVHIDRLLAGTLDFHQNFLSVSQLVYSSWPLKPGTGLPYQIGWVHLLLAIVGICFIRRIADQSLRQQLIFFSVILLAAIFLTLPYSVIIWEHLSILKFVQFPSRLLVIITFIISLLCGGVVLVLPKQHWIILLLSIAMLAAVNFVHCTATYGAGKVNLTHVEPSFVLRNLHPQDGGEYIPIWVKNAPPSAPSEDLDIIKGDARILSQHRFSDLHQVFSIESFTASLICFNTFYFPGWSVQVDGRPVVILKDNPYGLMIFPLDQGTHEIKIDFGATNVRRFATAISILSLLILMALPIIFTT